MTFTSILSKLKEVLKSMIGPKTIEQALKVTPCISTKMANSIELWTDMYEDKAPWLHTPTWENPVEIVSMGLPSMIASEKARMVVLEIQSEITCPMEENEVENPNYEGPRVDEFGNVTRSSEPETIIEQVPKGPTERAEYLQSQYKKLLKQLRKQLEYGIAKGGLVIKPYILLNEAQNVGNEAVKQSEEGSGVLEATLQTQSSIEFDFVQADAFFPLSFDASGNITEAAFLDREVDKDTIYSRLEVHKLEGNTVTITNRAFKSTDSSNFNSESTMDNDLGTEVPLTEISRWSSLEPEAVIKNVDRVLFAYFKMPEANTVDTYSPLGVSGYSRAVELIKQADIQFSRMLWEFQAGEMAIDIDRDALNFQEDKEGNVHSVQPLLQQRLFRQVDLGDSNTFIPYAPQLRDTSLLNGLNSILMRIEDVTALSRGTLSDVSAEARTATELKILKQRSYSANADIQKTLQDTLEDVVYIMNVYCSLYQITPEGDYETSFEWDDSILVDIDAELGKRITLMQNGLASKVETRMWYFGETEAQAKEKLMQVDSESQHAMEDNLLTQMNLANQKQQFGGNK